ncbi:DUF1697 domain-containing protein [Maribacter sp. MAR_2009_72]|uniref:DUF1697 domain-containing protein n=1 Tax=Maribacter sp. MAR_2009_72 TaxID=1250050 RepID=UPI00119B9282|nr:DUF1697 domain-containing protein [Maribacter sp. MAR_2009_72]TVZ15684.1 uncharacterized protein (DUF1697 family) [Maribacter sp. MAR_2009_72]
MNTYLAFLRGINVSGTKKVAMQSLRELCSGLEFQDVRTYIQSGNMVFKCQETNINFLNIQLAKAIADKFGFDVPVLVKTVNEVTEILQQNPYVDEKEILGNKVYFVLPFQKPAIERVNELKLESFQNETFQVEENCIYLKCNQGYGKAKLNNNLIEKRLNITATTRNYKTMHKLLAMAKEQ